MSMLRLRRRARGLGLSPRRRAAQGPALPSIVQNGLVAGWRFDDGAGQVLTDYTGNGHHGRLGSTTGADAADPTWTARGLSFDGGDEVEVSDGAGISGGVARTVLTVVKTNSAGEFGVQWRQKPSPSTLKRWTLRKVNTGITLRIEFSGGGHTSALIWPVSSWMLVGATQSGSNANTITLYLDGASEACTLNQMLDTQGVFQFGWVDSNAVVMEAAHGLVYNRALAPAEVEQNRQALKVILAPRGITLP